MTLVHDFENVGGLDVASRVLVVHRVTQDGVANHPHASIVGDVKVGSEFDRQSRRRRQVPEVYTDYAL